MVGGHHNGRVLVAVQVDHPQARLAPPRLSGTLVVSPSVEVVFDYGWGMEKLAVSLSERN